jgi:hypothetical protein
LIVLPEALAVAGEAEVLSADASAAATAERESLACCPLHAEFVLGPKHAVAIRPPTFRETVPESATSAGVVVMRSVDPNPVPPIQ